ncbi:Alkaline shock protein 23 [Actinoplanes sp. SE50]|uniref:Asp23/Gls24 family envelope stress response protein n=1 Tax=unclassified Actinoplanes TaxID=2626549 RepID=UPI00023ECF2C|nr:MULTISPECIES: Asp23/Gls24 family envelope stress response protein [unclassified Actinoplanes]AEV86630.1 Alkaline shock protein 23 [Actinoplanes sp. SE50/110]ATO85028.1 Alkaline shock protein 23 [Actinoplanes sp. SE50]SLM02438.1 alkaline shock protein 23 [Actinoplanes sp. SE50/110]
MNDGFHADRTQEMFLAVAPPVPPQTGGADVIEVAAYRGDTVFEREVIEKLAAAAARSVPGVAELGGDVARFFNAVLDRVGLDKVGDATRGVHARVDGIDVDITVVLCLRAGEVVSEVTSEVRARVIEAVEKYGVQVNNCTVKVDDILMPE